MKKLYTVKVPIVAVCYVNVEAETEEEAIDLAMDSDELTLENVEEWEAYKRIAEGNILWTNHNKAEIVDENEIEATAD